MSREFVRTKNCLKYCFKCLYLFLVLNLYFCSIFRYIGFSWLISLFDLFFTKKMKEIHKSIWYLMDYFMLISFMISYCFAGYILLHDYWINGSRLIFDIEIWIKWSYYIVLSSFFLFPHITFYRYYCLSLCKITSSRL